MIKQILNYAVLFLFLFSLYEIYQLREKVNSDIESCRLTAEIKTIYIPQKYDSQKYLVNFECCPYILDEENNLKRKCLT